MEVGPVERPLKAQLPGVALGPGKPAARVLLPQIDRGGFQHTLLPGSILGLGGFIEDQVEVDHRLGNLIGKVLGF